MILLSAILIGAIALETTHDQVPDTTTVGEILNLGGYNATNAANWAIGQYDSTNLASRISAKYTKPTAGIPMTDLKTDLQQTIYGKQDQLVAGTNIKTINNQSILGSGNIIIEGTGGTMNYNALNNKPKINGVELAGNKSLADIGAQKIIADYTTTNAVLEISVGVTNGIKSVAYSGSYSDLSNKPTALKNPNPLNIIIDGVGVASYDGSATIPLAIPTKLPNPKKITFSGAVDAVYDGSSATNVAIPKVDATDPTFSNAVLAVGLNIDTNSVAVLNEIAATFGGFPIGGTATTLGGLLAALAAAIAWLKKKKQDSLTAGLGISISPPYKWNTSNFGVLYTRSIPANGQTVPAYTDVGCKSTRSDVDAIGAGGGYFPVKNGSSIGLGTATLVGQTDDPVISTSAALSITASGISTPVTPDENGKADVSLLFSGDNTSNNLDNIRKSASESTSAKSYIDTQVATKAGLSDLPYNWDGMEFVYNSDLDKYVSTAADGTLNIVSAFTSEQTDCLVKLPIPSSGKVIDIIIQYDTSTVVPQFTYRPLNGSTMLPASNITWKNISGDTMATGTSKVYWVMIQLWPTSSAEGTTTFYGTQTIRELSAS